MHAYTMHMRGVARVAQGAYHAAVARRTWHGMRAGGAAGLTVRARSEGEAALEHERGGAVEAAREAARADVHHAWYNAHAPVRR